MKKGIIFTSLLLIVTLLPAGDLLAQCSLCTKTAQQLGEKPALGLNQGILYLMGIPYILIGYISYRWWKGQKADDGESTPNDETALPSQP